MTALMAATSASISDAWRVLGGYWVTTGIGAAASVLSAAVAPSSWLTLVLVVVTVLFVLGKPVLAQLSGAQRLHMGHGHLQRLLLVIVGYLEGISRSDVTWWAVAALLLVVLTLGEQAMRRAVRSASPQSANIPGVNVQLPSTAIANLLFWVNSLAVILMLAAVTGVGPLPALILAGCSFIVALVVGAQSIRYLVAKNRFEAGLPSLMRKLKPAFAFHWQAPAGTAYQAAMWLPYLERIGVPFFVLVRTEANFHEVARLTKAPVILRSGLEDLDAIVSPSLKAVFYANTAVRNSHMIRFPHLTHIQLNHGDSDKIASVSPTFRQYDKNFVAGQAAIDRFAKYGVTTHPDQFVIVGRPQLEAVDVATDPISSRPSPTVLYSPTWSGFYEDSDYSSLRAATQIVQELLDRGCTVIFRSHPYSRRHKANALACDQVMALLERDSKANGRPHRWGPAAETEMSVVECFNASDAMISDVSSLVSDFLFSGKPFAMAAVSAHGEQFREEFPLAAAAYVFDASEGAVEGLSETLDAMLGSDPLAAERDRLRSYYLGPDAHGAGAERFLSAARSFVSKSPDTDLPQHAV